jgi:hypothetical protein
MKALKSLICVVLISILTLSLAVTAFAGDDSDPWGRNCMVIVAVVK